MVSRLERGALAPWIHEYAVDKGAWGRVQLNGPLVDASDRLAPGFSPGKFADSVLEAARGTSNTLVVDMCGMSRHMLPRFQRHIEPLLNMAKVSGKRVVVFR